ncbi:hypothetical protein ACFY7H_22450 [Streptomyces sp. NPDC012794]|uniref:hypothetical protein n=1 Tax=Streptomyces sp. NPDC012794 TaxID=3364850 RepID=UPI0036AA8F8F
MADHPRFHLDRDGHSVTVQMAGASRPVEVLVDGKVVAQGPAPREDRTVWRAELPGPPPRPLSVTLAETGGAYLCEMELDGVRYLMPRVPLLPEKPPAWRSPSPHPLRRLRGLLRRAGRAVGGGGRRGH